MEFHRSFAYYTIQERLPIIVTKIIDQITRDKDEIAEAFKGEVNVVIARTCALISIII